MGLDGLGLAGFFCVEEAENGGESEEGEAVEAASVEDLVDLEMELGVAVALHARGPAKNIIRESPDAIIRGG